jgi:hypothetical protein
MEFYVWAAEAARQGRPATIETVRTVDRLPTGSGLLAFHRPDRRVEGFRLMADGLTVGATNPLRGAALLEKSLAI